MKRFIKITLFFIIFIFIFNYIFDFIWLWPTTITKFYEEPDNSMDVIYLGSSNAYAHFSTVLAYDEYGFKTGMLSTDAQRLNATKYLMEEARKTQNPSVYVIEITSDSNVTTEEGNARTVIDSLKPSINRINAINGMLKNSDIPKEEYINYYFSFLKYHVLWKNINQAKMRNLNANLYKNTLFYDATAIITPIDEVPWNEEIREDIPDDVNEVLIDLIKYIKDNDLPVLFITSPRTIEEKEMGILNSMMDVLKENEIPYLNLYAKADEMGIDFSHDLYNYGHLNVYGQTKFTLYFSDYLVNNYDLKDRRNDHDKTWDEEYIKFKEAFKNVTKEDFDEYLKSLEDR